MLTKAASNGRDGIIDRKMGEIPIYDPDGDYAEVVVESAKGYVGKAVGNCGAAYLDRETGDVVGMYVARISHAVAPHLPVLESREPIRRGDVVQVTGKDAHPNMTGATYVVTEVNGFGACGFPSRVGSCAVRLDLLTRIGRAAYYPDGTKVEG